MNTSLYSSAISINIKLSIFAAIFFLIWSAAKNIPYPNSALSSNNELAQAGPLPSWFLVYGVEGAEPPHIDEHPVALAIIILSPNNWVANLIYGVSPQPAHAPENSISGCLNWLSLTVLPAVKCSLFDTSFDTEKSQFATSVSTCVPSGFISNALPGAGQISTQLLHPVQSNVLTWIL